MRKEREEAALIELDNRLRALEARIFLDQNTSFQNTGFGITSIEEQLKKQTDYLARLEQVLQPLRKLGKDLGIQSKIIKDCFVRQVSAKTNNTNSKKYSTGNN